MSRPKRLIVEYEDGSTKEVDFSQLSRHNWLELSKLGLCPPPSVMPQPSKNYLLLRWQDGWQEVLGVDESSVELLRYYVLERVEEVGRMALQAEGNYPTLLMIRRKPKELDSLAIVGSGDTTAYSFKLRVRKEEGGKIEHVEYDKAERHLQHEPDKNAETRVERMLDSLKDELSKKGLTAEKLLAMDQAQRLGEYKELARTMSIRAAEKRDDVYGFIQLMTEKLAATGGGEGFRNTSSPTAKIRSNRKGRGLKNGGKTMP